MSPYGNPDEHAEYVELRAAAHHVVTQLADLDAEASRRLDQTYKMHLEDYWAHLRNEQPVRDSLDAMWSLLAKERAKLPDIVESVGDDLPDSDPEVVDGMAKLVLLREMEDIEALRE